MIHLDRTNPQHRSLGRLIIARNDIQEARRAATFVVEKIGSVQHEMFGPLSCATTVCYSRPFISRRKYPAIPPCYSKFPKRLLQRFHDFLIDHRNRFEAHRDEDLNEVTLVPKGTTFKCENGEGILSSHGEFVSSHFIKLESFAHFIELFNFQIDRLSARIDSDKERLFPD
jgi:hypothetical protein